MGNFGLIIHHGSPKWWLSPDIWVTPVGATNTSAPGVANPIAGDPYNVWVKVSNPTQAAIQYWSLNVFWAVPTVGPIPLSATTPLNESTIDVIAAGESKIIQAQDQWTPVFKNGGHECLVALTYNNATPFPFPTLDGDAGPDINWSIAQHNLGVLQLGGSSPKHGFHYVFQVSNSALEERGFVVAAREAPLHEVEWFLRGLRVDREADREVAHKPGKLRSLGLVASAEPEPLEFTTAKPVLEHVKVGPATCSKFSLVGNLDSGTALIHVTQTINDRVVGGLSVLVLSGRK